MMHVALPAIPLRLTPFEEEARSEPLLQVVPATFDPTLTPIPPAVCASILGLAHSEHDALVACGVLEQSCEVSPFGGTSLQRPLMMSNYWDLLRAAIILRLRGRSDDLTGISADLSAVLDEVAREIDYQKRYGCVVVDRLVSACGALEGRAQGFALLAAFTFQELPRRLMEFVAPTREAGSACYRVTPRQATDEAVQASHASLR